MNNYLLQEIEALITSARLWDGSEESRQLASIALRDSLLSLFQKEQEKLIDGLILDLVVIAQSTPPENVVSEVAKKLKELKERKSE